MKAILSLNQLGHYCSVKIGTLMKLGILLGGLCWLSLSCRAQESTWRTCPYFLKGYEKLYQESPKKASLKWFEDARFGLFVHWGPASLYGKGEWAMYYDRIPLDAYEKKAREFVGDRFNATDYVNLAVAAKMKYITFVVKHHDGFALWDTQATDYNSMDYSSQRDFLKELAVACKAKGIGLFIYYSIGIDWHHPYFMPNTMYDPAKPHYAELPTAYKYREKEDFKHYLNFAKTQIMELLTNYGPIAGFWFDTIGGVYQYPEMFDIQSIYDMIHRIQPHALVVFKTGANGNEDFITGERYMGSLSSVFKSAGLSTKVQEAADRSWELNKNKLAELNIPIQTIGWGYHSSPKQRQKSTEEVMDLLKYCADIKANLLLNIGPKPDGSILEENVRVLKEVGSILDRQGFPKLNTKDYMKFRNAGEVKVEKEKENKTAN